MNFAIVGAGADAYDVILVRAAIKQMAEGRTAEPIVVLSESVGEEMTEEIARMKMEEIRRAAHRGVQADLRSRVPVCIRTEELPDEPKQLILEVSPPIFHIWMTKSS